MDQITPYKILLLLIQIITLLLGILVMILIIAKLKKDSKLTIVINIQLTIICSIFPFFYIFSKIVPFDYSNFFSPLSDIGKISMATIIMLILQLNFVPPISLRIREKMYFIISIFIGWILPLTISMIALILDTKWSDNSTLYIIVVSIRFILVFIFFKLSYIVVRNIEKKWKTFEEIPKEYYNEIKHNLIKYRIVVGYNLLVQLGYSLIDLLDYFKYIKNKNNWYKVMTFPNSTLNFVYLIGFIINRERLKVMVNIFSCGKLFKNYTEIRNTNSTTIYTLLGGEEKVDAILDS